MDDSGFSLEASWLKSPIRNPSIADLNHSIERLSVYGDYVILNGPNDRYIQAAPWVLEYRQDNRQFQCKLSDFDRDTIKRSMTSYLEGQDFRTGLAWKEITAEIQSSRTGRILFIVAVICVAVGFVIWMYARSR
jgi:hypothetical protein